MSENDNVAWFVLMLALFSGVAGFCIGAAVGQRYYDKMVDDWRFEHDRARYYFDVANRHQLLDFCYDDKNQIAVLAKEDCIHGKP